MSERQSRLNGHLQLTAFFVSESCKLGFLKLSWEHEIDSSPHETTKLTQTKADRPHTEIIALLSLSSTIN